VKILISATKNMPIYEQITSQIRGAVIRGELSVGEAMPSIRVLAKDLQVSVITTKRAYEELEKEGIIEARQGRGFYVCNQNKGYLREKQIMDIENRFAELVAESKSAGMALDDITDLVRMLYDEK